MGIKNIHILFDPQDDDFSRRRAQEVQAKAALEGKRIAEHRRGEHPWGSMRRDCPYCQADK